MHEEKKRMLMQHASQTQSCVIVDHIVKQSRVRRKREGQSKPAKETQGTQRKVKIDPKGACHIYIYIYIYICISRHIYIYISAGLPGQDGDVYIFDWKHARLKRMSHHPWLLTE